VQGCDITLSVGWMF